MRLGGCTCVCDGGRLQKQRAECAANERFEFASTSRRSCGGRGPHGRAATRYQMKRSWPAARARAHMLHSCTAALLHGCTAARLQARPCRSEPARSKAKPRTFASLPAAYHIARVGPLPFTLCHIFGGRQVRPLLDPATCHKRPWSGLQCTGGATDDKMLCWTGQSVP